MRQNTPIPDLIIERAAELWARALAKPEFDNGDSSFAGFMAKDMAEQLVAHEAGKSDLAAAIERFRAQLAEDLKFQRDHEGEKTGRIVYEGKPGQYEETYHLSHFLSCDYGPDRTLSEAAQKAGVPARLFSWKSTVIINHDHVSASFGYGAEDVNHYPLPGGGWLITTLRGEDMPVVVEAVLAGKLDLPVEKVAA